MSQIALKKREGVASLEDILSYRNKDVIESFAATYSVSQEVAEEIFQEMLRFLWLCEAYEEKCLKVIDNPILVIDKMWHTFILFTRDYRDFCLRYFGHFLHHVPTTEREKRLEKQQRSPERYTERIEEKRTRYNWIYELLGRDIFIKWYYEFPELYSPERIRKMRK